MKRDMYIYIYMYNRQFLYFDLHMKQRKSPICIIFESLRVFSFCSDLQDLIVHMTYSSK